MNVRNITPPVKIFLVLMLNTLLFGGIFSLKFLGLTTESIILVLATIVSLEVACLAILMQMSFNKNVQGLAEVEKYIKSIREDEEKAHTVLIYIGHQMKAMQHELDTLRKHSIIKSNGNNHHIGKARA